MALAKLKFKEKILQQGIQTNELLRRLQELSEWDQDVVDALSLHKVAKQLLDKSLLLHKDKHVKALVAASFVDILRLCAPDAPYTLQELKDIFSFIFRQVAYLWKPPKDKKQSEVQCYQEYYYILRTMADVSCIVLVCDLPNSEDVVGDIFKDFLEGIRVDTSPRLQGFMADILAQLVDESNTIPTDILESMLIAFSDKTAKMNSAKHRLVVEVCNKTSERLQKSVCQYFSEILLKLVNDEYTEKTFDEVVAAHKIIRAIHRHSPRILLSTVPQLEAELLSENNDVRDLGTRTLGRMIGEPTADTSYYSLAKEYPNTFRAWIERRKDLIPSIRGIIVEYASAIILTHPQLSNEILTTITDKMRDFDDKVRAGACHFFQKITYEVAISYTSKSTLDELAMRCKDKKALVRQDAFESLGRLYALAYADIKINNTAAMEKFGWIPRAVLAPLSVSLPSQIASIKIQVERTLVKHILPLHADSEGAWVDRFLRVYKDLGEDEKKGLLMLTGLTMSAQRPYALRFVEACEEFNNDRTNDNKEHVLNYIKFLGGLFPEDSKATGDLQEFVKLNESRLYKSLKIAMDTQQCDFKTLQKSQSELHRRLEQVAGQRKTLPGTFDALLLKTTYPFINKSSVPHLLKRSVEGSSSAKDILLAIAKFTPLMLKSHISELSRHINDEQSADLALILLAAVARADRSSIQSDKRFIDRLIRFVDEGTRKQVKYATRILSCYENAKDSLKKIASSIKLEEDLNNEDRLMRSFSFLAEASKSAYDVINGHAESLFSTIASLLMTHQHSSLDPSIDTDLEWVEDDAVDNLTMAKLDAMRLCTHIAKANQNNPDQELDTAKEIGKLYARVLRNKGEVLGEDDESEDTAFAEINNEDEVFTTPLTKASACIRSRLRLRALIGLIKIAHDEKLEKEVVRPRFLLMSGGMQDAAYTIRRTFIEKLIKYLANFKLPHHYNVFIFLTAHEPVPDIVTSGQIYVQSMLRRHTAKIRLNAFEMIFYRLLHTLAHHPDFSAHPADIEATAKYITFYLELVATSENINLLYHLAGRLKTVRDITTKENSVNLYILSELGQHLTSTLAHNKKWTLTAYEGKVKLSTDIFKALPNSDVQREITQKMYLTEEMKSQLGNTTKHTAPRKKKIAEGGNKTRKPAKRAKKKHNWDEDDKESEGDISGDESDVTMNKEDEDRRKGPTRKARPQPRPANRVQDSDDDEMEEAEPNDENVDTE
ncbi:hypothetical protein E3P86_03580 [Wallemia ichthyophaga]|uniref:Sister chromatid cohesion protein pds5 n=1 Tax=Wallemia ichthyophaga TaxID=245174 RepID=A0A4T0IRY7_WALIC|nr:hypothetical protein E3P86_03580 [Wallemia ichthyophaga]